MKATHICSILGCQGTSYARSWCRAHYRRWQRHGDPMKGQPIYESVQERFWAKVDKTAACWEWAGQPRVRYGRFALDGRMVLAHRLAYIWAHGAIPDGLQLDHLCRNTKCVNPAHLEPVTPAENTHRSPIHAENNRAKTHCPRGHEYAPENTYHPPSSPNSRKCRECMRGHRRKRARAAALQMRNSHA